MHSAATILQALASALAVTALFGVPGAAWAWCLRPVGRAAALAAALALGLVGVLLPAILFAELGLLRRGVPVAWAAACALAGILAARHARRRDPHPPAPARAAAPGLLAVAAVSALLLAWPQRGEWLIGGWDPGVNMNQGLLLARTGAVAQPPDPVLAAALRDAPQAFSRETFGFTEVFPGVPADPATGALRPYFYRGTPTLIALLEQVGGLTAALRVNHLVGLWAAALLFGLLRATVRRSVAALATMAFVLQPVFLAHLAVPASEMLELALVCATGFLLVRPRDCPNAIALGLVLLLGALNRASFLFHQAVLLLVLTAWDAPEPDRPAASLRLLAVACSLALGLAWYTWIAPSSVAKIRHLLPVLHLLPAAAVAAAMLVGGPLLLLRRGAPAWTRALAWLAPAALAALECTRHEPWREFARNVPAWWLYAGPPVVALGAFGVLAGARRDRAPWLLWLTTALFAVLLHRHAAELYPWATKRWLAFSPPLLAVGVAWMLAALAQRFGTRGLAAGATALACALLAAAPPSRAAWRSAEADGSAAALAAVEHSLRPDDLVIADHFTWGTPLALARGYRAWSAEPLLAGRGPPAAIEALLAGQARAGRRIVLLTSTRDGLARWPAALRTAAPLGPPVVASLRERVQHRSHRGFQTRARVVTLQPWVWEPRAP